jgi:hypothetical protein
MVTTRSSSAKQKGLVKAPDWEALHLAVGKEERFRGSLADPKKRSQLQYILDSDFYWGDAKTIEDCSDEGMVDDGILFCKELTSSHTNGVGASSLPPASTTVAKETNSPSFYYYWLAYFGGNPTGYLLRERHETEEDPGWELPVRIAMATLSGGVRANDHGISSIKSRGRVMGRHYDAEADYLDH